MFDKEERRKEILACYLKWKPMIANMISEIISQEKLMIAQAKKEFAEKQRRKHRKNLLRN